MKVIEQDLPEKKKGRIFLAVGNDEIFLLHALLERALLTFPLLKYPQDWKRMNQMRIEMARHLGTKKNKAPKSSEFPCPQCPAYLRDEAGVNKHIKTIHSGEFKPDPRTLTDTVKKIHAS